jgi:hypothetical protein
MMVDHHCELPDNNLSCQLAMPRNKHRVQYLTACKYCGLKPLLLLLLLLLQQLLSNRVLVQLPAMRHTQHAYLKESQDLKLQQVVVTLPMPVVINMLMHYIAEPAAFAAAGILCRQSSPILEFASRPGNAPLSGPAQKLTTTPAWWLNVTIRPARAARWQESECRPGFGLFLNVCWASSSVVQLCHTRQVAYT